jgi:outer membrane scaffolding protein for murein synthesis (MipA/OmpV family)
MPVRALIAAATLAAALPLGAAAQGAGLSFTLKGGADYAPEYPGSDEYEVLGAGGFAFQSVRLRNGFVIGDEDFDGVRRGFGVRGAFNVEGERDSSEYDDLAGLDDVDAAVELGLGLDYFWPAARVYGELRYGVTGHDSVIGEVGADAILRPSDRLTLLAGPRVTVGSDGYNEAYFGVSPSEAAAAGGPAAPYDPSGGVTSVGVEMTARYALTDRWGVEGVVSYDYLTEDAGDSPIVQDRDQYGVGLRLTRRFTLDF